MPGARPGAPCYNGQRDLQREGNDAVGKTILILLLSASLQSCVAGDVEPSQAGKETDVASDNSFAADLYARLAASAGADNLFFSPYGIRTALAMTFAGARGTTASQMSAALHLPDVPSDQLHKSFAELDRKLNGGSEDFALSVANALWGQRGFGFRSDFKELLRTNYSADLREVDFLQHTEEARLQINQWAEQATRRKIKDLIPPGVLDPASRLVLANAIYFKAGWDEPFAKQSTRDGAFHLDAKSDIQVLMMHHRQMTWGFTDTENFQAVELPYQGHQLSMVLLVPKAVDGLAKVEKLMSGQNLRQWQSMLAPQLVIVTMPKFTMTRQFKLADQLQALGMSDAFSADRADFSGMVTAEAQKTQPLYISEVVHKAFVAVDEEGTEAAAATAVAMRAGSAMMPRQPVVVTADRPFLFYIHHRGSGTILFMGRVNDPR